MEPLFAWNRVVFRIRSGTFTIQEHIVSHNVVTVGVATQTETKTSVALDLRVDEATTGGPTLEDRLVFASVFNTQPSGNGEAVGRDQLVVSCDIATFDVVLLIAYRDGVPLSASRITIGRIGIEMNRVAEISAVNRQIRNTDVIEAIIKLLNQEKVIIM